MRTTKFQHATPFNWSEDYHKYVIMVIFDGEPEWWGADNPELALKELLKFYYNDKGTNRTLPVTVFQKERYNEFDLKGDSPKLLTQDMILSEAREVIEQTTKTTSPATIGAVKQSKSKPSAATKLKTLMEIEGHDDTITLFESAMMDSVCPGICMNSGCDYTTEVEPDQTQGWCEECKTQSVKSALSLGGII